MKMDDACEGSLSKSVAPAAPPLPGPATSYHQKGLVMNGLPLRGYSCVSTAAKDLWERLFDSGYKADVTIFTDYNGIIYAHANVLVSLVVPSLLNESKITVNLITLVAKYWNSFPSIGIKYRLACYPNCRPMI